MAVNFSGGIDISESFARGFAAIADVNLKRQQLNLEAAQMVQNYNLKQQELEQSAQFLPIRYQTALVAQEAARTRGEAALRTANWHMDKEARIKNDVVGFTKATEGADPSTVEGMRTILNARIKFPFSPKQPEVVSMSRKWKEMYPESGPSLDAIFERPVGLDPQLRQSKVVIGKDGRPIITYDRPPEAKTQRQMTRGQQLMELDKEMLKYELRLSDLKGFTKINADGNVVRLEPAAGEGVKEGTKFERIVGKGVPPETWQKWQQKGDEITGDAEPAAQPDNFAQVKSMALEALQQRRSVSDIIRHAKETYGVTLTPEDLQ